MTEAKIEVAGPNAEQIEYWNEVSGPKWVRLDETISAMIRPFGVEAMKAAKPMPGERVIDVGCGCGETTFALSEEVGSSGHVLGIDISAPMLARAREVRERTRVANVEFMNADVQTQVFTPDAFDLVYSRFGVMFFQDPEAAFANLRSALRSGGRLAFACWQARERNPWLTLAATAAARHFDFPKPPPIGTPGPFSLCDADRTAGILERAGYHDVTCRSHEGKVDVSVGKTIEDTVSFLSQIGPVAALLSGASPEQKRAAIGSIHGALVPHQTSSGIELNAAVWIVRASKD